MAIDTTKTTTKTWCELLCSAVRLGTSDVMHDIPKRNGMSVLATLGVDGYSKRHRKLLHDTYIMARRRVETME